MKRSRSQRRIELDTPIINRMVDIKKDHPNWGYRRVWAYIRYRDGVIVGKNRIYRLMSEANKLVPHNDKIKASRTASRSKPVAKV
ncbi:transposase, partial [bacterium]|nr:transposase [bacterium]